MSVQHSTIDAFAAKGCSNHDLVIDSEYQHLPVVANDLMELVLVALGSDTASDEVVALRKEWLLIDRFVVQWCGDQAEDHPRVYKNIQMRDRIYGKR